jgi:hypothetical protein
MIATVTEAKAIPPITGYATSGYTKSALAIRPRIAIRSISVAITAVKIAIVIRTQATSL